MFFYSKKVIEIRPAKNPAVKVDIRLSYDRILLSKHTSPLKIDEKEPKNSPNLKLSKLNKAWNNYLGYLNIFFIENKIEIPALIAYPSDKLLISDLIMLTRHVY